MTDRINTPTSHRTLILTACVVAGVAIFTKRAVVKRRARITRCAEGNGSSVNV
jgi:hypothetical protein